MFLSSQTLNGAVYRLSVSAAQSSLADYLIFKRALKLRKDEAAASGEPEPQSVVTGTKSRHFVTAIDEFALRVPPEGADVRTLENPYYLPFGSRRDSTLGYRTPKYPSNGSSDTASRWQARNPKPLLLVPDTSPKEFSFEELDSDALWDFFSVRSTQENNSGEKPRLLDTAVWWFRFANLSQIFDAEPSVEQLTERFIADLALTDTEVTALFERQTDQGDEAQADKPSTEAS